MEFKFLGQTLHAPAEKVAAYFRNKHGVTRIEPEAEVHPDVSYRPTLIGTTQDHYTLCVDVTDEGFSGSLETFILDCGNKNLPVKCYIAVTAAIDDGTYRSLQAKAQEYGVGLVEIGPHGCTSRHEAMPLTLFGYRRPDPKRFPPRYRQALTKAESVLRAGDPVKACSNIYDEIEGITRAVAIRADSKQLWRPLKPGEKLPRVNRDHGPWRNVLDLLNDYLDYRRVKAMGVTFDKTLVGTIVGMVRYRNESGHKPKTKAERITRDRQLRTRFEHAVDTLEDVIKATKRFRI